jgi:hypothetical protein
VTRDDDEIGNVADLEAARVHRLLSSRELTESRERFFGAMDELAQGSPTITAGEVSQLAEFTLRQAGFQALRERGFGVTVLVTTPGGEVKRISTLENSDALRAVLEKVTFP